MRKTKKALASLAIAGMVLSMAPVSVFGATTTTSNRIQGADRVATAIAVADKWTASDSVIVVPADDANIVDALAAAPLAGQLNAPILVTYKGALDPTVQQKIVALKATKVYAVGALSTDAVASLNAISGVTVTQLQGADRTATAALVSAKLAKVNGSFVVAYNGTADALSAASFAAANSYSIIVANPDGTIPTAEAAYKIAPTYTVGGQVSVAGATALFGADRYATNDAVVKGLTYQYNTVYVANGETLVDALAGAPLAAQTKSPIVLADATHAATGVNASLTATSQVIALGGSGAVSDSVLAQVAYQVPATLVLQSVTAINQDQIKVVFNQKVDKDTAENTANYKLNGSVMGTGLTTDATAALQDDGVTVIISAGSTTGSFTWNQSTPTLTTGQGYVLTVDGVKNADLTQTASKLASSSFTYSDTTGPSVVSVTANASTNTTSVAITFNEPVRGVGLYTINGKNATYTPPTLPTNKITVNTTDSLVANTSYTLQVINERDAAGNLLTTNPTAQTFNVTINTAAPTATTSAVSDNEITASFSTKMDDSTLVGQPNIKLLNSNGVDISTLLNVAVSVGLDSNDNGAHTLYDISLSGSGASGLFDSTTKQLPLTVVFTNAVKDSLGNKMAATSQYATLTLDQTAPTIVSAQWVKAGATYDSITRTNGALVLTFSEKLVSAPAIATTSYSAITDKGVDETTLVGNLTGYFKTNSSQKVVIYEPALKAFSSATNETVRFNGSLFTDASLGANKTAASVVTVDVLNALTGDSSDTIKPIVTVPTQTLVSNINETVYANLGEVPTNLDMSTVLNLANYRLNGAAMPTGTWITVDNLTNEVILHLPSQTIATSGLYALTVSGIADIAGNIANTATNNVTLVDNTSPVMNGISFNSDGTVTVAFDTKVGTSSVTDFTFKKNGTVVTPVSAIVIPSGADIGKVLVTGLAPVAGDTISVTTTAAPTGADASGNTFKTGVTVSATK